MESASVKVPSKILPLRVRPKQQDAIALFESSPFSQQQDFPPVAPIVDMSFGADNCQAPSRKPSLQTAQSNKSLSYPQESPKFPPRDEFQNHPARNQPHLSRSRSSSTSTAAELFGSNHSPETNTNQISGAPLRENGHYFVHSHNTHVSPSLSNRLMTSIHQGSNEGRQEPVKDDSESIEYAYSQESHDDHMHYESPALSTAVNIFSTAATAIYHGATTSALGGALRSTFQIGRNAMGSSTDSENTADTNMARPTLIQTMGENINIVSSQTVNPSSPLHSPISSVDLSLSTNSASLDPSTTVTKVQDSIASSSATTNNHISAHRVPFHLPLPSKKIVLTTTTQTVHDPSKAESESLTSSAESGTKIGTRGKYRLPPPLQIQTSAKEGLFRTPDRSVHSIKSLGVSPLTPMKTVAGSSRENVPNNVSSSNEFPHTLISTQPTEATDTYRDNTLMVRHFTIKEHHVESEEPVSISTRLNETSSQQEQAELVVTQTIVDDSDKGSEEQILEEKEQENVNGKFSIILKDQTDKSRPNDPREENITKADDLICARTNSTNQKMELNNLQKGRIELVDPSSGLPYYYNETEGVTTWDRPSSHQETDITVGDAHVIDGMNATDAADYVGNNTGLIASGDDVVMSNEEDDGMNGEPRVEDILDEVDASGPVVGELPAGWMELVDPSSGLPYYYNETEDVTTWDRPSLHQETDITVGDAHVIDGMNATDAADYVGNNTGLIASGDDVVMSNQEDDGMKGEPRVEDTLDEVDASGPVVGELPAGWMELVDPSSGLPYYYNETEGVTTWDRPSSHQETDITAGDAHVIDGMDVTDAADYVGNNTGLIASGDDVGASNKEDDGMNGEPHVEDTLDEVDASGPVVGELPAGWMELVDPSSGLPYYYNETEGVTTWDRPSSHQETDITVGDAHVIDGMNATDAAVDVGNNTGLIASGDDVVMSNEEDDGMNGEPRVEDTLDEVDASGPVVGELPAGWMELVDPSSGLPYYYNETEGVTTWDRPSSHQETDITVGDAHVIDGMNATDAAVDVGNNTGLIASGDDVVMSNEEDDGMNGEPHVEDTLDEVDASGPVVGELPAGWMELVDPSSGLPYYYNETEGVTTWDRPSSHQETDITVGDAHVIDGMNATDAAVDVSNNTGLIASGDDVGASNKEDDGMKGEPHVEDTLDEVDASGPVVGELPAGWMELVDPSSGLPYYYNETEGVTTWDRPSSHQETDITVGDAHVIDVGNNTGLIASGDDVGASNEEDDGMNGEPHVEDTLDEVDASGPVVGELPAGWMELVDPSSGLPYYYNETEGVTTWDRPSSHQETDITVGDAHVIDGMNATDAAVDVGNNTGLIASGDDVVMSNEEDDGMNGEPHVEDTLDEVDASGPVVGELPAGWMELVDPSSGLPYYYNETEGVTTWDRPPPPLLDAKGILNEPSFMLTVESTAATPVDEQTRIPDAAIDSSEKLRLHRHGPFRPRPGHALASFGFGGRLCVMIPKRADILGISTSKYVEPPTPNLRRGHVTVLRTSALLFDSFDKFSHMRPFIFSDDSEVLTFLRHKASSGISDKELLWKLIIIAAKFKGRLRSSSGSHSNTPESAIVDALVSENTSDNILFKRPDSHLGNLLVKDDGKTLASIESSILLGKRDEAVQKALSTGHHCLALLIASVCDVSTFKGVARTYIENELCLGTPLSTLCTMIANDMLSTSTASDGNIEIENYWRSIPPEVLVRTWRNHLASILSNQMKRWREAVISLGDVLVSYNCTEASQFCFMVAGCPIPSSRIALVGCDQSIPMHESLMSDDGIESFILTEAFEWAKRKGNPQAVIASLQPMKLSYAFALADLGYCEQALAFVESIKTCLFIEMDNVSSKAKDQVSLISSVPKLFLHSLDVFEDRLLFLLGRTKDETKVHRKTFLQTPITNMRIRVKELSSQIVKGGTNLSNTLNLMQIHTDPVTSSPPHALDQKPHDEAQSQFFSKKSSDKFAPLKENEEKASSVSPDDIPHGVQVASDLKRPASAPVISAMAPIFTTGLNERISSTSLKQADHSTLLKSPVTAPVLMTGQTPTGNLIEKSPDSAPSSGKKIKRWNIGISDWLTKKLNPDATRADIGGPMEAYFDEKLKRWVFPGDDLTEVAKPLPPPPTSISTPALPSLEQSKIIDDPLQSMMAPPSVRVGSRKGNVSSARTSTQNSAIPQFAVFQVKAGSN